MSQNIFKIFLVMFIIKNSMQQKFLELLLYRLCAICIALALREFTT